MSDLLREITSECPQCGTELIGTYCDDCGWVEAAQTEETT